MRCAKCGSTNVTSETQPTRGYNLFGTMVVETQKKYHCMACGNIGDYSWVIMDYETEAMIDTALKNNNVAKLQNFKRKYRNFEWTPPAQTETTKEYSWTRNVPDDPNFQISYGGTLRKYNGLKETVYIPDGVKEIGNGAFSDAFQVTSVTIPTSVTKIDDSAFSYLKHLTSVVFEKGTRKSESSIGKRAFKSCINLMSIEIPNDFTTIGEDAFDGCFRLLTVTLPDSLKSIGYSAFSCCFDLTSIVIPDGVTSIGFCAFSGCKQMTSVTLSTLNEHFNFYLENEQQFKSTERYVYVSKKCKAAYSFAYANLLMNICSDFESLIRAYFDKENSQPINIDQIIGLIQSDKDLSAIFSESCQYQKTDYGTFTPLEVKTNQKNNIKSFEWWTANNSVKHNKVANITRANQKMY